MCATLVLSTLQWVRKFKKTCPFCLHLHAYITPCPFRVPQVLERWLTCVCWHVTWNTWIISIRIDRKCLFNKRFPLFISTCAAEKSKSLVCPRSARRNADFRFLDTNSLILIGFGVCCVGTFYASVGEKIQKEISLLSALTCVHHPMPLSRTSGIRHVG